MAIDEAIVEDLWTDPPVAPPIDEALGRRLLEELAWVRRTGESRGIVVLGRAGAEKARLLACLRRAIARERSGFLVRVPAHAGLEGQFLRHALQHLVLSLERPEAPGGKPPLHELFAAFAVRRILGRSGQVTLGPRAQRELLERGRALLLREAPGADPQVLAALAGLFRGQAGPARDWLRGQALAEGQLQALGLARSIDSEDQALAVIQALSALAWLGGRPVVVCFDQVDACAGDGRKRSFAEGAAALVHARGNLVLTMCLVATWKEIEAAAPDPLARRLAAWAAPELEELEQSLLGLLASHPVQDLARLCAGLGGTIPEERIHEALSLLERRGRVALHVFEGRVQVRRA